MTNAEGKSFNSGAELQHCWNSTLSTRFDHQRPTDGRFHLYRRLVQSAPECQYPYKPQYYTAPPTPALTPSVHYSVPQMSHVTPPLSTPCVASGSSPLKELNLGTTVSPRPRFAPHLQCVTVRQNVLQWYAQLNKNNHPWATGHMGFNSEQYITNANCWYITFRYFCSSVPSACCWPYLSCIYSIGP